MTDSFAVHPPLFGAQQHSDRMARPRSSLSGMSLTSPSGHTVGVGASLVGLLLPRCLHQVVCGLCGRSACSDRMAYLVSPKRASLPPSSVRRSLELGPEDHEVFSSTANVLDGVNGGRMVLMTGPPPLARAASICSGKTEVRDVSAGSCISIWSYCP